ncbi:MAG: copper-binding protein [Nitrospinota bacterium]
MPQQGPYITMEELHRHGGTPRGWKFRIPPGDPESGREVFIENKCFRCHAVEGEDFPAAERKPTDIGPPLSGMGGHHPAEYLAESIVNPNAVILVGKGYFGPDGRSIMPTYADLLTMQELVDLVAYLKSLTVKKRFFEGIGKVIAVLPQKGQIILDHGLIKGFMGPMTMGYRVKEASLLQGLKPGDKILFTIDAEEKVITGRKRLFEGVGKVVAVNRDKGQVVLHHEEIKGFMSTMTMTTPVKEAHLLKGLKPGDKIRFTIEAEEKVITGRERLFEGVGKVVAVIPDKGQVVLHHGEIKGFMPAMTMTSPVKEARLLQGLKPGDKIRFTIEEEKKTIVEVEKVGD